MGMRVTKMDDPDRLSERIWTEYRDVIYDKESFDTAYDDYMGDGLSIEQDVMLRKKVYENTTPKIERYATKERALRKQQLMTSGVEKGEIKTISGKTRHQMTISGKIKDRLVFGYAQQITRKKKQIIIVRDRKGRFVKRV